MLLPFTSPLRSHFDTSCHDLTVTFFCVVLHVRNWLNRPALADVDGGIQGRHDGSQFCPVCIWRVNKHSFRSSASSAQCPAWTFNDSDTFSSDWVIFGVSIMYNTLQLYCLCVEKFAFWLVIYIKAFNTVNNKTSTAQWNTELKTAQIRGKYLTMTMYTHTHTHTRTLARTQERTHARTHAHIHAPPPTPPPHNSSGSPVT